MWLWLIAGFGAVAGAVALWSVHRLRRRLADLSQAYWELRYEYTRLRSQVARLDPERRVEQEALRQAQGERAPAPASFVPLSSLKSGTPQS